MHNDINQSVLVINGLYKKYDAKSDYAIKDINFSASSGQILGVLGHNGAGKSTTLKCILGMLPFDKGNISICGYDIASNGLQAKQQLGFVTDNHAVFVKMTGREYINFMADVYKVSVKQRAERLEYLDSIFLLQDALDKLVMCYSHGMKQKICMMGSLIHNPKLWILDEPMTGLDPRTMNAVGEFIKMYSQLGNTVVFSSHDIATVKKLCDRVVIINNGAVIGELDIKQLLAQNSNFDLEEYFFSHGQ